MRRLLVLLSLFSLASLASLAGLGGVGALAGCGGNDKPPLTPDLIEPPPPDLTEAGAAPSDSPAATQPAPTK